MKHGRYCKQSPTLPKGGSFLSGQKKIQVLCVSAHPKREALNDIHTCVGSWVWGTEVLEVFWITPNLYLNICEFHLNIICIMHIVKHTC